MALLRRNLLGKNLVKKFWYNGQVSVAGYSRTVDNPTAGIIVIGDEILKAQVKDINSNHICSLLYNCGVKVKKISVLSDEVDVIAEGIINFSKKYTYVITSGGIGPTHDDVTFEALAKAFDDSLHYHPKLVEVVRTFSSSQDVSSPAYKLANIPASASLKFGGSNETGRTLSYPCVNVKNVYVFPGSPIFLQKSFGNVYKELFAANKNFVMKELHLRAREELFADALTAVSKEFPNVTFGSYPTINHSYYSARVTIESSDEEDTDKAIARFKELAPLNSIINYDSDSSNNSVKKFTAFVSADKEGPLYEATLTSLKEICSQPSKAVICFDGSVEATVLLHLTHVNRLLGSNDKLQALYLKQEKPFEDVDEFIKETVTRYNIELHTLEGSAKEAIEEFASIRPEIGTLLLGLKGDKTKGGFWHSLARSERVSNIRVRLVLTKWTYENVWNFVRSLNLPYCKLYDRGYTSLGNRSETQPNPNLIKIKNAERTEYHPAYMLKDTSLERAGRNQHSHPQTRRI